MPPRTFDLDIRAIRKRLEGEGWTVRVATGDHDVYKHPQKPGRIPVPRGRGDLPLGAARNIARSAGWLV
ncbi:type II toxin-antitoxin system HicA family toxin [Methylobacterium sp. 10]|uniref:type II toxin-antitoxin system HicA family toxin n=1 Tax=Methylobacterium sp. 10 TaxID=1101191 RepID=UPI0004B81CA8|nr:type II toxin-antitoxin system HicA family toxin [Methylobacterium sp. 10]